jgi:hypothetical protein
MFKLLHNDDIRHASNIKNSNVSVVIKQDKNVYLQYVIWDLMGDISPHEKFKLSGLQFRPFKN